MTDYGQGQCVVCVVCVCACVGVRACMCVCVCARTSEWMRKRENERVERGGRIEMHEK